MTATILDGKALAAKVRAETTAKVTARTSAGKTPPGLATLLVGDYPPSQTYVRNKRKSSEEVCMVSFGYEMPAETSQAELLKLIAELNGRHEVHGILVQV